MSSVALDDSVETILAELSSEAMTPQPAPAKPLQVATPREKPAVSVILASGGPVRELLHVLRGVTEAKDELLQRTRRRTEIIVAGYGQGGAGLISVEEFDAIVVARNLPTYSAAVNAAARAARGKVLVLMEPDMIPTRECLCHILEAMADRNSLGGGTRVNRGAGGLGSMLASMISRLPLALNGLSLGVLFVRRRSFDKMGGFKEAMLSGQMLEFALRLKKQAVVTGKRFDNIKAICATRRAKRSSLFGAKEWLMLLVFPLVWRP